jgi:hypothetical protein
MPAIDYVEVNTDLDAKRTWYVDGTFEDDYNDPAAGFSVKRIIIWEPITITDASLGMDNGAASGTVKVEGDDISEFEYTIDDWATSDTFTGVDAKTGTWSVSALPEDTYTLQVRHATLTRMIKSVTFQVLRSGVYGTKWQLQFDRIKIPATQAGVEYTLNINKKGYSGSINEICGGPDPIIYEHVASDENDLFDAIIASRLNLQFVAEANNMFLEIFDAAWDEYTVTLVEGLTTIWTGFFDLGSYEEDYIDPPFYINVTAVDGFSFMKKRKLQSRTGNRWNALLNMSEFIWHMCREFRLPQTQYIWMHQYLDGTSGCPLEDIYIDCNALYVQGAEDSDIMFWDALYSRLRPLRLRTFIDNQKCYVMTCERQPPSGGYPTEYRGTPGSFTSVSNDYIATIGTNPAVDTFYYLGGSPVLSWESGVREVVLSYIHNWTAELMPRTTFVIPDATEAWIENPMLEPYLHEDEYWGQNLNTAEAYYETIDDAVTDSIATVGVKRAKNVVADDEGSFYAYGQDTYALLCTTHSTSTKKYFKCVPIALDYDGTNAPRVRFTLKGNAVSDPQLYLVNFSIAVLVAGHWLNASSAAATLMVITDTGTQDDHESVDHLLYRQPNTVSQSEGGTVYNRPFSVSFEGTLPYDDQSNPTMQIRLYMLYFNPTNQANANAGVVWDEITATIVDQEYEGTIQFSEEVAARFDGSTEYTVTCMSYEMAGGGPQNRAQYFKSGGQVAYDWAEVGSTGTKTHQELLQLKLANELGAVRKYYSGRFGSGLRFYHRPYINSSYFINQSMQWSLKNNWRTVRMLETKANVW